VEQKVDDGFKAVTDMLDLMRDDLRDVKIALGPLVRTVASLEETVQEIDKHVGRLEEKTGLRPHRGIRHSKIICPRRTTCAKAQQVGRQVSGSRDESDPGSENWVARLMISSNFAACSTGRSAGLEPFRILGLRQVVWVISGTFEDGGTVRGRQHAGEASPMKCRRGPPTLREERRPPVLLS
jgi:hypothetical protein